MANEPIIHCKNCQWWDKIDPSYGRCRYAEDHSAAKMESDSAIFTHADFGCIAGEAEGKPVVD